MKKSLHGPWNAYKVSKYNDNPIGGRRQKRFRLNKSALNVLRDSNTTHDWRFRFT